MASNDLDPEDVRIGATCRGFRQKFGLKPDPAASALGISRAHLANIEAGRRKLNPVLLANMAKLYEVEQVMIARPDLFPQLASAVSA